MNGFDHTDKLLVIAPHPDDEVIGCGGIIQRVKKAKGKVYVLFLTIGDTKDFSKKGLSKASERENEVEKVAKFLKYDGFDIAFIGSDYQLKLDTLGQLAIMNVIERESRVAIEKIKPTVVAFPSIDSYNQDHQIAAKATHAALRTSSKEKYFVKNVIAYEEAADIWTLGVNPNINLLVPLTDLEYKMKVKALKLYKSQWRDFPSSRSGEVLESLAKIRGSMSGRGKYAEGFYSYRSVVL